MAGWADGWVREEMGGLLGGWPVIGVTGGRNQKEGVWGPLASQHVELVF